MININKKRYQTEPYHEDITQCNRNQNMPIDYLPSFYKDENNKQLIKKSASFTIIPKKQKNKVYNRQQKKNISSLLHIPKQQFRNNLRVIAHNNKKLIQQRQALFHKNWQLVMEINQLKSKEISKRLIIQQRPILQDKNSQGQYQTQQFQKSKFISNFQLNKTINHLNHRQLGQKDYLTTTKDHRGCIKKQNYSSTYTSLRDSFNPQYNNQLIQSDPNICYSNLGTNQKTTMLIMPLSPKANNAFKNKKNVEYSSIDNTKIMYYQPKNYINKFVDNFEQYNEERQYYKKEKYAIKNKTFIREGLHGIKSQQFLSNLFRKSRFLEQFKQISKNTKMHILQERIKAIKKQNIQLRYQIFQQ